MTPATSSDDPSRSPSAHPSTRAVHRVGSDIPFYVVLIVLSGTYVLLLIAMLAADLFYTSPHHILAALGKPAIQYSLKLSLISCSITTLLSLWVAVPIGYLLARHRFWGHSFVDAILDIPIVLPPLVVGLSLLILFQFWPFRLNADWIVYQIPAVILAQFMVACAFASTLR